MADNSTDICSIAFGFRNVPPEARPQCVREAYRILKPGGLFAILELGLPRPGVSRQVYSFLLHKAMPPVAGLFSPRASYDYLAKSIQEFPEPEAVKQSLQQEGFIPFAPKPLSGGMCWLFVGRKPMEDFTRTVES